MRDFITISVIFTVVFVAIPAIFFGSAALSGGLADVSYSQNLRYSIIYFTVGIAVSGTAGLWFWHLWRHRR